ncbi:MAG: chemotaxis protein CheA [Dethiobacteraceae bacterium]|jgi:two-component system chemotaxis sensor kinase CheA|nr:chemotaxis protein CheA [Bacillota bacterium]
MADHGQTEQMLEMYIYETTQNIEQLEAVILAAENADRYDEDSINEIFRIMHTIKGSSAMMLFDSLAALAHKMEDLFYFLRERQPAFIDYSLLSDLVLEGIDFMKVELQKIKNGDPADGEAGQLLQSIENYVTVLKEQTTAAAETAATAAGQLKTPMPAAADSSIYKAVLHFAADCGMENIRAYTLVLQLQEQVAELQYLPEDLDSADSAELIREKGFTLFLRSDKSYAELEEILAQTLFLERLELSQLPAAETAAAGAKDGDVPETMQQLKERTAQETNLAAGSQAVISVSVSKLDQLMDLVGEMVIAESMVTQNPDLKGLQLDNFEKAARQLHKITGELQDLVMSIRMVPLATTFHKMHRLVRDMSRQLNKEVKLQLLGEQTEVDKNIIEHIADPLMHLIRNAMDHGLERKEEREALGKPAVGTITLEAKNAGSDVLILVKDDGRGLNKAKILERAQAQGLLTKPAAEMTEQEIYELVFLPGFSTKKDVTEFSGRGVGMDVVANNLQLVGGSVAVDSVAGEGCTFTLKIPLTLAIIDSMNVKVGNSCFTIPIASIKECLRAQQHTLLHDTNGDEMLMVRGVCYPIIRLHQYFALDTPITDLSEGILIMVEHDKQGCLLFVDELLGQQEVVVKALPAYIRNRHQSKGLSGCTLLGDGSISLILDVGGLLN